MWQTRNHQIWLTRAYSNSSQKCVAHILTHTLILFAVKIHDAYLDTYPSLLNQNMPGLCQEKIFFFGLVCHRVVSQGSGSSDSINKIPHPTSTDCSMANPKPASTTGRGWAFLLTLQQLEGTCERDGFRHLVQVCWYVWCHRLERYVLSPHFRQFAARFADLYLLAHTALGEVSKEMGSHMRP